ncbi:hypothetical protein ZMTM_13470 [Methyloradius palustris]|uniref:Uncharacterized protein n=1 Tax=Methyloradius palustris TaxID=2778876 RepID=A0A8D5G2Z4_9PROT|nr:hypothetical protein ZMTM_13470 [Methyloradius palustris]
MYTDEGRHGNGNGKELCDLLVVFGNDVILFSDKACKFTAHENINVAWSRWYRRAVEKSARQLSGAESWIKRFPNKIYLDSNCKAPLPVKLPKETDIRIHLVAVTRGASEYAESYWGGGSSGSLFIDTKLVGDDHKNSPFRIGWALSNKRLVHVFDETTLDIVLGELDTISDFISYLTKKEERFTTPGSDFLIPGEEELVAFYLQHYDFRREEYYFPVVPEDALVVLQEGGWRRLKKSRQYQARCEENEISYLWDTLIEFQNDHILAGSAEALIGDSNPVMYERIMRMMAEENRLSRRSLGESINRANSINEPGKRFTRTIFSASREGRAYIFMTMPRPEECNQEEYLELRRGDILLYAYGCKLKFEKIKEIIGIAFAPGQEILTSVDYFLINFGEAPFDEEFADEVKQRISDAEMWSPIATKWSSIRPIPFPYNVTIFEKIIFWTRLSLYRCRNYVSQLMRRLKW